LLNKPLNLDVKGSCTQKFEPLAQHPDPQTCLKLVDSYSLAYSKTWMGKKIGYV
jgi:hypothetical protein